MQTEYSYVLQNTISDDNNTFADAVAPSAFLKVSVIVPARNEARNICKALNALRLQTDNCGKPLNPQLYEVLLLVNNCSDQTYTVARNYQQKYPDFALHLTEIHLHPSKANIGFVRRLLMDEAYRRLSANGNLKGIIASTDGDTQVDACWVYHIMQEIANGCDAVGGRILTRRSRSVSRIYHLRDVAYRTLLSQAEAMIDPEKHDPWPRHFQYFGASMAVTCNVYHQVGRLPQVPYLEDNAFHQALQRMDVRIRKTPAVKAYTSTRTAGRVEVGFSEQLKKWSGYSKNSYMQEVEPVGAWLVKFKSRRILRQCWEAYLNDGFYDEEIVQNLAENIMINAEWLHQELISSPFFGLFWEKVRGQMGSGSWGKQWKLVHITQAIQELRIFVNRNGITLSQTNPT